MLKEPAGTTWFGMAKTDYHAGPSLSLGGVDPDCAHFVPRDSQLRVLPTEIAVHCLANSNDGSVETCWQSFPCPSDSQGNERAQAGSDPWLQTSLVGNSLGAQRRGGARAESTEQSR